MTDLSQRRIELWVEARDGAPAVNPIMQTLLDELIFAGAEVSVRVPEHEITDPGRMTHGPPDLILLKSATTLALTLAVAEEIQGVTFLNGARPTLRAHDKAATVARLAAAGLPVPETYLFESGVGCELPEACGGWVVKPARGVHGLGVGFHQDLTAALAAPTVLDSGESYVVDDGTRLVQRRIGGDEPDVKVYVAGDRCFAGSKPFGPASYATDLITPLDLDPGVVEVVRAAGEVLGLHCFGVDLRLQDGSPVIIDANPFPGYRGFPEAVPALQSEIERVLELR